MELADTVNHSHNYVDFSSIGKFLMFCTDSKIRKFLIYRHLELENF